MRRGRSSESPAHSVQILDDIYKSFDGANALGGNAAYVIVGGMQPGARFGVVATDERIE
jgi:hypothetical protein